MIRLSWVQPEDLLAHELVQAQLEGKDVRAQIDAWLAQGGSIEAPAGGASPAEAGQRLRQLAAQLLEQIDAVPPPASLLTDEPDDLEAIESLCPGAVARAVPVGVASTAGLADRVKGAWAGRATGCVLGKPVEKVGRAGIREILVSGGRWPLRGYFTEVGVPPEVLARHPWNRRSATNSLVENLNGTPEDDDLNFALIALSLLERHGHGFDSDDVVTAWLDGLPGGRVFTAERVAYRNLLLGLRPPQTATAANPFREWIGAQIRTDVFGWANPANPIAAARLAWRDARVSHVRGGIYGAMFVAGMCAAALVVDRVDVAIESGLSVIPPQSRFAAAVRRGVELGHSDLPQEGAIDRLYAEYGHLHWVHGANNAALVAFALTRSRGVFVDAICTVVSGGWDSDSNGATVGSVCGALSGYASLPSEWIDPLRGRLSSSIPGFDGIGFDELTARTIAVIAQ